MAWYRFKRIDKNGRKTYEIRHNEFSKMWIAPEGWSDRAIEKELQKEAVQFANECQLRPVVNKSYVFIDYSKRVLDLKRARLKPTTIAFYEYILNKLGEMPIATVKLVNLKPMHLNNLYKKLSQIKTKSGKPLSSKTLIEFHRFISSVLDFAINENLITFNVAKMSEKPKHQRVPAPSLELDDIAIILEAIEKKSPKWAAFTHLLLASGMRRGEALGLRWTDIDKDNCIIYVHNNLQYLKSEGLYDETLKTNSTRYVTIAKSAIDKLSEWQEIQEIEKLAAGGKWIDDGYVFTQSTGKPVNPSSVTTFYRRLSQELGIAVTAHMFRHFQASVLIDSGVNILTVSKRLGHKDVSTTTDIYAHLLNKADARASGTFEAVIYNKG